jgi:hypothetical protein
MQNMPSANPYTFVHTLMDVYFSAGCCFFGSVGGGEDMDSEESDEDSPGPPLSSSLVFCFCCVFSATACISMSKSSSTAFSDFWLLAWSSSFFSSSLNDQGDSLSFSVTSVPSGFSEWQLLLDEDEDDDGDDGDEDSAN